MKDKSLLEKIGSQSKILYEKILMVVSTIILLFITATIIIGTARLFYRLGDLFRLDGITGDYLYIFTDVLTLFILIELSKSLYEYITIKKLRIALVIDAAIVFILRDIMIALFKHQLSNETAYALSALILVLGILRIGFSFMELQAKRVSSSLKAKHD